MAKSELKDQLDSLESYINDIPMVINPCRVCKFVDKNKTSHNEHIDVCSECCWYYDSKFEVGL